MTTWPTKKLGEISRIFSGSSAPQDEKYFKNGKYPFVRVFDLSTPRSGTELVETRDYVNELAITELNLVEAQKGAIVFPKSGASILNNNRAMLGTNAYVVSHLSVIEVNENLAVKNWVYYFLSKFDMGKLVSDPGYPSLNISAIEKIIIPLPPLEIQKQIVERLDKIAEARKLNDGLIQKTDELFQSLLHKELNPAGPAGTKAMAGKKKWKEDKFINCIEKNPLKIKGIPREKYQSIGKFPIINQSDKFIVGYTDNEEKVYKMDSPVIIFGDHTRIFKYADFNFAIGADGTQIIIPTPKKFIPKFFYFSMLNLKINNLGYSRHFKLLKTKKLVIPPLKTQKQIVTKLSAVQDYKKQLLGQKAKLKELFDSALAKSMSNK